MKFDFCRLTSRIRIWQRCGDGHPLVVAVVRMKSRTYLHKLLARAYRHSQLLCTHTKAVIACNWRRRRSPTANWFFFPSIIFIITIFALSVALYFTDATDDRCCFGAAPFGVVIIANLSRSFRCSSSFRTEIMFHAKGTRKMNGLLGCRETTVNAPHTPNIYNFRQENVCRVSLVYEYKSIITENRHSNEFFFPMPE